MRRSLPVAAVLGLLVTGLATGCGTSSSQRSASAPVGSVDSGAAASVDVSVSDCGSGWTPTTAGVQALPWHNADKSAGEVEVVGRGARAGLVYADIEPFGPGTT